MGIRVVCVVLLLFVREWWAVAIVAAGAIFLPYFAVVIANASGPARRSRMVRPGGIVRAHHSEPDGAGPRSGDSGSRAA